MLSSRDAFWRPPNQMRIQNTDLPKQLEAGTLGARFWRLRPGQASTSTLEMDEEQLAFMYPDGPKALPPELGGGQLQS